MKIDINKKYRTVSGIPVKILAVLDEPDEEGSGVVVLSNNKVWTYNYDGSYTSAPTNRDLVEVSPYEDWKIDDPIMVSYFGSVWERRYFAGVTSSGVVKTFINGLTSWTTENTTTWALARKPTEEERIFSQ